jgi:hypothetical protein
MLICCLGLICSKLIKHALIWRIMYFASKEGRSASCRNMSSPIMPVWIILHLKRPDHHHHHQEQVPHHDQRSVFQALAILLATERRAANPQAEVHPLQLGGQILSAGIALPRVLLQLLDHSHGSQKRIFKFSWALGSPEK